MQSIVYYFIYFSDFILYVGIICTLRYTLSIGKQLI